MFTESTQMYLSVIVQMSVGNERKKKKDSKTKPRRSSRQEAGAAGATLWQCNVLCFYLRFLVIWYMHCNSVLQSVTIKGASGNFISYNRTPVTQIPAVIWTAAAGCFLLSGRQCTLSHLCITAWNPTSLLLSAWTLKAREREAKTEREQRLNQFVAHQPRSWSQLAAAAKLGLSLSLSLSFSPGALSWPLSVARKPASTKRSRELICSHTVGRQAGRPATIEESKDG